MPKTIGVLGGIEAWAVVPKESPHDTTTWVKVVAYVRNNATGEIRQYRTEGIWDKEAHDGPVSTWIWEEGNFSCDCNRKIFWGNAAGEDYLSDSPCGDGGFSVNLQNPKTGQIFYREYGDA